MTKKIKRFAIAAALLAALGLGGNAAISGTTPAANEEALNFARQGAVEVERAGLIQTGYQTGGYQTGGYQTGGTINLPAVQINLPAVQTK